MRRGSAGAPDSDCGRGRARYPARTLASGAALLLLIAGPATAVNRLTVTVGQLTSPAATLSGARVALDLAGGPSIAVRIEHLRVLPRAAPALDDLRLTCERLTASPPYFACRGGQLSVRAGTLGVLTASMAMDFDRRQRTGKLTASDVPLAGGHVRLSAALQPGSWTLEAHASDMDLAQASQIAQPWVRLPAGYKISGHADAQIALTDRPVLTLTAQAQSADLNLTNAPGTVVAQQVSASFSGTLSRTEPDRAQPVSSLTLDAVLHGSKGQALAGPVLLDFSANPLAVEARLERSGSGPLMVSRLDVQQRNLVQARARGVLQPGKRPAIVSAHVDLTSLRFPAAYSSYLQLALATTALGSLQSSGGATGSIDIANDAITHVDCSLHDINFTAPDARILMQHASGEIHWAAAPGTALPSSNIAWERAAAYGLSGGPVRLQFVAWQRNFALLGGDTRLPVFDGAVIVHTLVGRDLGTPQAKVDFDADVSPISMPQLSKAFGWPVMSGALAGHIPLVRYRGHDLTFDGDLVAKVFDGTITGSHIVLRNPLGPWPSLSADVLARSLDLDLLTHTFAFGSITGRVDVEVNGLQLFNWSPVAFDARLYTTPGDRSPHRVSQNAVTRIAGLGGAAGAVKAALESGVLRFFHTFRYDRIGIGCRLQNEVCGMSGVAPAPGGGYYLIEGSGLPRLDIIGNVHRVDWPQLIGQVEAGMRDRGFVVNTGRK